MFIFAYTGKELNSLAQLRVSKHFLCALIVELINVIGYCKIIVLKPIKLSLVD